jgi:hypothetical protein
MFSSVPAVPYLNERLAEAAHYALMRRLMPAIRHDIAGTLQPIGMMAAMLHKRMQAQAPDLDQLGKNSQALSHLSREAAATSQNLMTWLAPRDNNPVAVSAGIEESLSLISTELSFRGFSIANETADLQMQLPRAILRSVFTASLIALTDKFDGAARIVVTAVMAGNAILLQIVLEAGGSPDLVMQGRMPPYRVLGWDDVQALAGEQGVGLNHDARTVQLRYEPPGIAG